MRWCSVRVMRRTNKLRLRPTEEQEKALLSLCEMSAVLWNKLNYIRRQSFFGGRFDWEGGIAELYNCLLYTSPSPRD